MKTSAKTIQAGERTPLRRTYGVIEGMNRKGVGFYAVECGRRTDLFYKTRENALKSAKRLAESLAGIVRNNGHLVEVIESSEVQA